jgi:hypothetical protein
MPFTVFAKTRNFYQVGEISRNFLLPNIFVFAKKHQKEFAKIFTKMKFILKTVNFLYNLTTNNLMDFTRTDGSGTV